MEAMMVLGDYVFGLNTAAFQELNRNTEWRWGSQDVFDDVPTLQFTGWGKDTITLPGIVYPEYWGGTGQLDALRALADLGEVLPLIDGRGYVLGDYVITGVQERQSTFAAAGVPLRQEFTITLERQAMGEVPLSGGGIAGLVMAANNQATASGDVGGIIADAGAAGSGALGALGSAAAALQGLVASVSVPLTSAMAAVDQAMGAARNLQHAASMAKIQAAALGNITNAANATTAVASLLRAGSEVSQSAARAAGVIQGTVGTMAGQPPAAIATVRNAMATANSLAVSASTVRARAESFIRGFA
jgi:phage protein U